jgi:hypothetical protein
MPALEAAAATLTGPAVAAFSSSFLPKSLPRKPMIVSLFWGELKKRGLIYINFRPNLALARPIVKAGGYISHEK